LLLTRAPPDGRAFCILLIIFLLLGGYGLANNAVIYHGPKAMRHSEKLQVLTLGWEFPPLATGGLGPAFYGLSKALSTFVKLTILLPRSEPSFKLQGADIIGLNHLDSSEFSNFYPEVLEFTEDDWFQGPYPIHLPGWEHGLAISPEEALALFNDQEVYGPNLMRKVQAYVALCSKLAKSIQFDVIHAHDWLTYLAGIRIKAQSGKPLVIHVHSLETDRVHPDVRNQVYQIEWQGIHRADKILAVSQFTRQSIIDHYQGNASKIIAVHNALDDSPVTVRKVRTDYKSILFLGRVTHQKGPDTLFKVIQKLAPHVPNLKVFVAGVGDQLGHLKWQVEQAGLEERFVFTGYIKKQQVHEILAQSDAYFMPSVSEPFGLSAIEAAQFDIPCVISKQSGVSEVLHNSLKANFWDIDKLANYLYATLHYQGLRETMVGLSRRDLRQINWLQSAKQVIEVYKELS
jgi:glycogen synthase